MKITVFNTKYIKYFVFYLLSYFGIAIMVDFKFVFMLGNLNLKWLNFQEVDATFLSIDELDKFYESCFDEAKKKNLTLSLHLKCTMMKVSDPVLFAHAIKSYFKEIFELFGEEFKTHGVEAKNGLKDMFSKISTLKNKDEILAKNVGLMAKKAEEYGSHDKTFIAKAENVFWFKSKTCR